MKEGLGRNRKIAVMPIYKTVSVILENVHLKITYFHFNI